MTVNAGEIGKLDCSLCSTDGRNDLHRAPLLVLSHCLCHFAIPSFFSPLVIVLFVIFSYSTFSSSASAAASVASLSASSLPFIPVCDFTQPKWIVQFCVVSRTFSVYLQLLACVIADKRKKVRTRMSVSCECCMLSGCLRDGPITRLESYRVCCVQRYSHIA
jgi:hypothetical protein